MQRVLLPKCPMVGYVRSGHILAMNQSCNNVKWVRIVKCYAPFPVAFATIVYNKNKLYPAGRNMSGNWSRLKMSRFVWWCSKFASGAEDYARSCWKLVWKGDRDGKVFEHRAIWNARQLEQWNRAEAGDGDAVVTTRAHPPHTSRCPHRYGNQGIRFFFIQKWLRAFRISLCSKEKVHKANTV